MKEVEVEEEEIPPISCLFQDLELSQEQSNDSFNTDSLPSLDEVEEILGYKFTNKNLLKEAFTHPSLNKPRDKCSASYERLEFIGAAILDMLVAKELYLLYPDSPPKSLSLLRSSNVDSEKLARAAIKHGFHQYFRYNRRSTRNLDKQIKDFSEAILECPVHSNGIIDVPKFLAYVVEATVAAIFIDSRSSMLDTRSSFETVLKITKDLLNPMIDLETVKEHPMTELQELCQKNRLKLQIVKDPRSKVKENIRVDVLVDGNVVGTGNHRTKKDIAQNRAAKAALDNLKAAMLESGDSEVTKDEEEENYMIEIDSPPSLDEVEEILGYKFSDRNLLEEAFIHGSYYNNSISMRTRITSYERLEFVGDAVLSMLMAEEMYSLYPDLPHGQLTRLRAANVDNEKLARVAIKYGFHNYLRSKGPHLDEQVHDFNVALLEYPGHSNGLIDAPKSLADLVEAIIGAVFVDSNFCLDTVWKIIRELLKPMTSRDTLKMHPNAELHELCQKNKLKLQIIKDSGDHLRKTRRCDVVVEDNLIGTGIHEVKKEIALNRAAKAALDNLKTMLAATKVISGGSA